MKRGRKPVKDKKERVELWLRKSLISANGGKEPLKKKLTTLAEKELAT